MLHSEIHVRCSTIAFIIFLLPVSVVLSQPYKELVPNFNPMKSSVTVRTIEKPTLANLDYAAYNANPVLIDKEKYKPRSPERPVKLDSITFGGALDTVVNSIEETPLAEEEKSMPLSWVPMKRHLWDVVKDSWFQQITSQIDGHKWADPSIYAAYQNLSAAYIHTNGESETELWVRVDFKPWVAFLDKKITDTNQDYIKEVYGKVNTRGISEQNLEKVVAWIRDEYTQVQLNKEEVVDWITALASYWYPTKNTDLVDTDNISSWPDGKTINARKVRRELKGIKISDPIAIVEAKPYDPRKPVYNVFIVKGIENAERVNKVQVGDPVVKKVMDTGRSINFKNNENRFADELKPYQTYSNWAAQNQGCIKEQRKLLDSLPPRQMALEGKDGWVFFRKSLEYTTAGDILQQPDDKNPLPHLKALARYLGKNNVNFLFVPVPVKSEVYFENLPLSGECKDLFINPYGRKILSDIQKAGIEVIDLLPAFLEAKKNDHGESEALYQKQDTHWTNRGIQIASTMIAERVKQYSWYKDTQKNGVEYTTENVTFSRLGDIVERLPQEQQVNYAAAKLDARQVFTEDGDLFRGSKAGDIVLMGDSFTGVYELIDCKGAGIGAHIAQKTGLPLDLITSWGGGPLVRNKMLRARKDVIEQKRLVIYMMVARDLYDYSQLWKPLETD